jgi:hypothetical protein
MKFKKLIFTEEDKKEIARWRKELDHLIIDSGEMENIYAGYSCGGVCSAVCENTCSYYCEPACEKTCSSSCRDQCSDLFLGGSNGGCLGCDILKIIWFI